MAIAINRLHEINPLNQTHNCKLTSFIRTASTSITNISHGIHRSSSTPCLTITSNSGLNPPKLQVIAGANAPGIQELIVESAMAIATKQDLIEIQTEEGGVYFLQGCNGGIIAVVKPVDEKTFASRSSVRLGGTGIREVAAYLLDHDGFSGVPPTALVKLSHPVFQSKSAIAMTISNTVSPYKLASLQKFLPHDFDAGEIGTSSFPVASVHRIGILDVRLFNVDRHSGNILVKKNGGRAELVPIDHGLCLPESMDDPYFEWLHWPQASVPFSESEAEFISRLDPMNDAELLRQELPSMAESSIRILILCTIFLKCAASSGLCLADIGDMMSRDNCGIEERPSVLETLCAQAMFNVNFTENGRESEDKLPFNVEIFEKSFNECIIDLPRLHKSRSVSSNLTSITSYVRSICGFKSNDLSILEEVETDKSDDGTKDDNNREEAIKAGNMIKSASLSFMNTNHENSGISFAGMNEEEWKCFLQNFEKLLPKAFEARKSVGLNQRSRTSRTCVNMN